MEATNHHFETLPPHELNQPRWFPRWIPSSLQDLAEAEQRLFSAVRTRIRGYFVPIFKNQSRIWTVAVSGSQASTNRVPLVLLHGFAGGVGIWCQNYDFLAERRTVYAFDLLGFGRSSRPKFPDDATNAELEWVQSIESWREHSNIEQMILLGHSLGGYLAASYALEYPQHVRHLVLVDPWGFPSKPTDLGDREIRLPTWVRTVATVASLFNPLSSVRAAGPWGISLVRRFRPDLGHRMAGDTGDVNAFYDYIYHCNAQKPSGEIAFKEISIPFGWAKRPMAERMPRLHPSVPVTFIYGSRSWIDSGPGYYLQQTLTDHYIQVETIRNAGHHVYADRAEDFNEVVDEICAVVDEDEDLAVAHRTPPKPANASLFSL